MKWLKCVEQQLSRTYLVFLFIKHERSNGPTGIGTVTSLTADTNGGMTNTQVVDSARDSMG